MLPESQNKLLTSVGVETPMGGLLRRYWWPIAGVTELDATPIKAVRLLGEDLVVYKDLGGAYGMVDRHCPHRRADLSYGFVEQCGIRCNYHGWLYDATGQCIEQPYEDTAHADVNLKARIRTTAYPVQAKAGLLWAYLGPQPAPLLPDWEFFNFKNGFRQIVIADVPCNWLQCQENSIDPVHFEWMHSNWSVRLNDAKGPYTPTHIKVDFTEFEYGFQYKRIKADTNEQDPLWTTGRVCLWPNALYTGDHIEFRVPVDDENTLSVGWFYDRVPRESEPYVQDDDKIPTWHGPIKDPKTGRWITSHVMNQDFIAWVGQGTIADRSKEHLGASDRGVAAIRRRFLADLEAIKDGKDPKAIIRDPAVNKSIEVPIAFRKALQDGKSINDKDLRKRFVFQAGQPDAVKAEFEAAMGFVSETPVNADRREFEKAAFGR